MGIATWIIRGGNLEILFLLFLCIAGGCWWNHGRSFNEQYNLSGISFSVFEYNLFMTWTVQRQATYAFSKARWNSSPRKGHIGWDSSFSVLTVLEGCGVTPSAGQKKKRMNLTVHADMVDCNSCGLFFEEMFYLFCFVLIICLFLVFFCDSKSVACHSFTFFSFTVSGHRSLALSLSSSLSASLFFSRFPICSWFPRRFLHIYWWNCSFLYIICSDWRVGINA